MSFDDVRMRGFVSRSTVEAATGWIHAMLARATLAEERVDVLQAVNRVLACDITSDCDVPGFRRSMMDGFAPCAEETTGATPYNALSLQILGNSLPGAAFSGSVGQGQAVAIMTGAPMPPGANAVLPAEFTETRGNLLLAMGEVSSGKHVGDIGEDVRREAVVLRSGRMLRPQDVGLLSSIGCQTIRVVARPQVRVLITGNEVLPTGSKPQGNRIVDANGPMLQALVYRDGGRLLDCQLLPDHPQSLADRLMEPADVVLVSGGSSVGVEDHAPRILAEKGELAIHGIAMRPSAPTGMGRIADRLVFLLPGNPVSCLCAYDFFAGRAIRGLGGRDREWPYRRLQANLQGKLSSMVGRVDYARVKLSGDRAIPLAIRGASILSTTTEADGFVVIPMDCEGYADGTQVDVFQY